MSLLFHAQKKISRRHFLYAITALLAASCTPIKFDANVIKADGLGALAKRRNRLYGAAVQSAQLDQSDFAAAVKRECTLLVPESELKWAALRPNQNSFDFSGYHRIRDFAQSNTMTMRGHVLVWHYANPAWLEPALTNKKAAESILKQHIQRVIAETSPYIKEWDVVNEAVSFKSTRRDGLRNSPWLKALGPDYIPLAFRAAHEADKNLTLVYNDFATEFGDAMGVFRRKHILALLHKLKKQNVPVHALGLQSHLMAHRPLGGKEFIGFLRDIRAMGLKVLVTELDMDTSKLGGTAAERMNASQSYLATYLDMVQQGGAVNELLTWGLSDRASWMREYIKDVAGALPLDEELQRAPMWETLRAHWASI